MIQNSIDALALASVYGLFALGISLVWGTVGILNFAHGVFFMFCAYLDSEIVSHTRLPMIALIALGVGVGAALSVAIQLLAFDPILRRTKDPRSAELQILIAGIGVAAIPLAIAENNTSNLPFGFDRSTFTTQIYRIAGNRVSNIQIVIFGCAVVVAVAVGLWLHRSRNGLALRALGVDPETAAIHGVNRRTLGLGAMAMSGALAGLSGILFTYYLGSIDTTTGDDLLLKAFAVIVLGGIGSVLGVVVGALVLASAETLVLTQTSGTWVDAVSFGIIFVVLIIRPQGLFGQREVRRT